MFAVAIALFFAAAAIGAVLVIAQSFAGSAERFDALFAAYRAAGQGRGAPLRVERRWTARGAMTLPKRDES